MYTIQYVCTHMDVSENNGTPKSSILIGFSIINHPFWGTPIFGNTHIQLCNIVTSTFFTYTRCFMNHSLGWSCGFVAVNEERFEDESKEFYVELTVSVAFLIPIWAYVACSHWATVSTLRL